MQRRKGRKGHGSCGNLVRMVEARKKKIRKAPEERKAEIEQAALKLISERGYNGISLKDIADEVGISQPGLLHYIGNKEGLLSLLITDVYDTSGTPDEFLKSGLPGSDPEAPHFPAYLRYLVRHNAARRTMVQLFMVLGSEALNEQHLLHDYYMNHEAGVWKTYSAYPWKLPPEVGGWENMRQTVRMVLEAMDGVQLRWLREPPIDYYDEWLAFERILFPSPVWDAYR
ncbi:AcrR family transcriptional regulator [Bifidobacterium tissieri]|uniref:AcrR family transcriptional regulator n=2 Tax=Bifidobacterium tissieri TaxID=1630162 RepID=A0A261FC06_9BIFI|nr:AcrR family transcriptional regulator [Bifidobacterium tissieri]